MTDAEHFLIRKAREQDIEGIVSFDKIAQLDSDRRGFIRTSVRSNNTCVAELDGRIVAYVVQDRSFFSRGFISMLYIDTDFRRRGIGSKLVRHIESICQTDRLFTSTNASNQPMKALLEKLGYSRSGLIDNLDDGDPELIYFKILKLRRQ